MPEYEDIFNGFASVMKEALPLENTIQFLTALKSQVGNMGKQGVCQASNANVCHLQDEILKKQF